MKKILIILILYPYASLSAMEKQAHLAQSQLEVIKLDVKADFFGAIPTPVRNMIMEYLFVADNSCKEVDKSINALGRTNKAFSQSLLYDPATTSKIIHTHAQRYKLELDTICPHDLIFAAAYQLNTFEACKWLKTQYFKDHKNFKIISASFFQRLNNHLPRTTALRQFMLNVLPKPKEYPPIIKERLNAIRSQSGNSNRYLPETKRFMEILGAKLESPNTQLQKALMTAICHHNNAEINSCITQGADVDREDSEGDLPLKVAICRFPDCIPQLLKAGANPNNQSMPTSDHETTPLEMALCRKLPLNHLELLLAAGANTESKQQNLYNGRIIRLAIARHPEAIPLLLKYGASLTSQGLEEIEYAQKGKEKTAINALEEYRKKRWPA